jgi:hypothetical protein
VRWVVAVAGLLALAAPSARAQAPGTVHLTVRLATDSSAAGAHAPVVRSEHLLDDGRWISALRSGLPVRLHYTVVVWRSRGGWFDAFERQVGWDVVLRHEPLLDQYTVLTLVGGRARERRYATLDALSAALAFAYQVSVRPEAPGRYYYTASLEISTLSDSDLDELQRFLEGDLGDGAEDKNSVGDVLGRGATRFLLRLAGLPSLRLEVRSQTFDVH